MNRAYFSLYVLLLLVGIGALILQVYENKGRQKSLLHHQYLYHQMQLYEDSLFELTKVCLSKYSLQECSLLKFDLGEGYWGSIALEKQTQEWIKADLSVEYFYPLSGELYRSNARVFLKVLQP